MNETLKMLKEKNLKGWLQNGHQVSFPSYVEKIEAAMEFQERMIANETGHRTAGMIERAEKKLAKYMDIANRAAACEKMADARIIFYEMD